MNVTVRDRGLDALIRRLSGRVPTVTTGVHSSEGAAIEEGSELTVAEVLAIHEFGLGDAPQRSVVRDFVDDNRRELERMLRASAKEILSGRLTPKLAMNRFGLAVAGMMKERVIRGIDPPLLEATKREKQRVTGGGAKDTPLIRFGQLISAIAHELR